MIRKRVKDFKTFWKRRNGSAIYNSTAREIRQWKWYIRNGIAYKAIAIVICPDQGYRPAQQTLKVFASWTWRSKHKKSRDLYVVMGSNATKQWGVRRTKTMPYHDNRTLKRLKGPLKCIKRIRDSGPKSLMDFP